MKEEDGLIKIDILVAVPHPKGGNIAWTCLESNIIKETEEYRAIGICGFIYKMGSSPISPLRYHALV